MHRSTCCGRQLATKHRSNRSRQQGLRTLRLYRRYPRQSLPGRIRANRPQQLPPVQISGPRGITVCPTGLTRVFSALPVVAMTGPQAAYLIHTGNTNEATGGAELGTKPDIGPHVTRGVHQAAENRRPRFRIFRNPPGPRRVRRPPPTGLTRSVYNAESLYFAPGELRRRPDQHSLYTALGRVGHVDPRGRLRHPAGRIVEGIR